MFKQFKKVAMSVLRGGLKISQILAIHWQLVSLTSMNNGPLWSGNGGPLFCYHLGSLC